MSVTTMNQPKTPLSGQTGGITIMVSLMLLVLLTISAVGMSRNAFKEIVATGFVRQGAMARNVADSGIEWSIHWLVNDNASKATGAATQLLTLQNTLLQDSTLAGVAKDPIAGTDYHPGGTLQPSFKLTGPTGYVEGYTLGLTRMGKLPITMTSQGLGAGAFSPAAGGENKNAPDLWAARSDAQVKQGGVTFIHAKEAWISTPVQSAQ